jgi:phosphatidyl-myo-inositol alpha-mannosyltransferase
MSKRPLNVCIVATYNLDEAGGVKHHAFAVAEALRRRGDRVTVVGPSATMTVTPELRTFGGIVNVQANGCDVSMSIFCSPLSVRRFFAENSFDVIHVHEPLNPMLGLWSGWLAPRTPHVATFHAFGDRETWSLRMARALLAPTVRPYYQRAFAVSEPAWRWAVRSWKTPIQIIPNGVAVSRFIAGTQPDPSSPFLRLLFVGKLTDPRKGLSYLLDAYRRLRARRTPVTLDVVGDRGGQAFPDLPGVTYHGSVTLRQLVERYRACDVFVAPATGQESFGMILLEAMATARPIVCSSIEGYRQVVDGEGALLVPPLDAPALERAILQLAADPVLRWRMGVHNRHRAEAFDWSHIAQATRDEYCIAIEMRQRGEEAMEVPRVGSPNGGGRAKAAPPGWDSLVSRRTP